MPQTDDTASWLDKANQDPNCHLLIMTDQKTNQSVYCFHDRLVFQLPLSTALQQLFDISFSALRESVLTHQTSHYVPLLDYIGTYRVTIVERDNEGQVTMRDGENQPVDSHLGVGG